MIETISQNNLPIEIDLLGKMGSADFLFECAKKLAYILGLSEEEEKTILKEMYSDNYENMIRVFDKYFGEFVILYR